MSNQEDHNLKAVQQNSKYYYRGGDLHLLADGQLFRVHRHFFEQDSDKWRGKLSQPASPGKQPEGTSDSNAIMLPKVSASDLERFLWVFYNPTYSLYEASFEDWSTILRLAHTWAFTQVKALCVRQLEADKDIPIVDRIVLYQTYKINEAVLIPRYVELCSRDELLTEAEATNLGISTTVMICSLRERLRSSASPSDGSKSPLPPGLDAEDIASFIRATMSGASVPFSPTKKSPTDKKDKDKKKDKEEAFKGRSNGINGDSTGGLNKQKTYPRPTLSRPAINLVIMVLHHNAKYFLDFMEFVVDEELFRIPCVPHFASDSLVLGPRIRAGEKPIDLTGFVSANEFEQFLEIILPLQITSWLEHPIARWCLVLKLANAWQIEPLRKVAIQKMGWEDTISRIEKGQQYLVAEWVEQGYVWLVQRFAPLTVAESERLGWPIALKICHLREERAKGKWNHPDLAGRINTAFADEFKRIRDGCTWLSKPKAITLGPRPTVSTQPPRPVDGNGTVKDDLPKSSAPSLPGSKAPPTVCSPTTPQTFAFKSAVPPVKSDIHFSSERPPAQAAFVFGPSDGDKVQTVGPPVNPLPLKAANGNADNPTKASALSSPAAPASPILAASQTSLPFPLVKTNAPPGSASEVLEPAESKGLNGNPGLPKSTSQVGSPKASTSPKPLDDSKRSPTQGIFGPASERLKVQEEILGPVPIAKPDLPFASKSSYAQPTFFFEPSGSNPQEDIMGAVPNVKPDALAADTKPSGAQPTSLTGGASISKSQPAKPIKVNGRTVRVNLPKAPSDSEPESSSAVRPPDSANEGKDDETHRILSRFTPVKWDI
ncbi:hypothetical protein EYR36_003611 [Pleurotus pulmonarius]|nr:hypothetical protein EYR36_003611 [Pleurotus pulmonarius]